MKRNYLILVMLIAMGVLCACSNDEPAPTPTPENKETAKKWPDLDYDNIHLDPTKYHTFDELNALGLYIIRYRSEQFWAPMLSSYYTEVDLRETTEITIEPEIPGHVNAIMSSNEKTLVRCPHFLPPCEEWFFWPHTLCYKNIVVEYNNPFEITVRRVGIPSDDAFIIMLQREVMVDFCGTGWSSMAPVYLIVYQSDLGRNKNVTVVKDAMNELIKEWNSHSGYPYC